MVYELKSHNVNLGRRLPSVLWAPALMIIAMCVSVSAQSPNKRLPTRIVEQQDSEARQFMVNALDLGLPERMADQMAVLAVNRSYLVVPELLERLEAAQQNSSVSERFVHAMADLLAYAADETALDALVRLGASDPNRFGPFIGRALDYARGRRNPYSLAYYAIGKSTSQIDNRITRWVETNAPLERDYRAWAMSIVERNSYMPTEAELIADPIISRLSGGIPLALHEELLKINPEDLKGRAKN